MLDLKVGAVLLFLVPGLCAYCALYGIFGHAYPPPSLRPTGRAQRRAFAPAPPAPGTVKAATFIVLSSIVAHAFTALFAAMSGLDVYRMALLAGADDPSTSRHVGELLLVSLLQGIVAYVAIRIWLRRRAVTNRLPFWLYGWTATLANYLDDDDKTIICVVLTTIDIDPGQTHRRRETVAYAGMVEDLAITLDGSIKRVNLIDCQRFLVDLSLPIDDVEPEPLATFARVVLDAAHIRNVAFEIEASASAATTHELLVAGLRRLYGGPVVTGLRTTISPP